MKYKNYFIFSIFYFFQLYHFSGMVVTYPGCKPCSVRVDQLDRNVELKNENNCIDDLKNKYPEIVHFGIRPPQLSYAGNPE